jgi:TATA-binding protein-associated factor Taf7
MKETSKRLNHLENEVTFFRKEVDHICGTIAKLFAILQQRSPIQMLPHQDRSPSFFNSETEEVEAVGVLLEHLRESGAKVELVTEAADEITQILSGLRQECVSPSVTSPCPVFIASLKEESTTGDPVMEVDGWISIPASDLVEYEAMVPVSEAMEIEVEIEEVREEQEEQEQEGEEREDEEQEDEEDEEQEDDKQEDDEQEENDE